MCDLCSTNKDELDRAKKEQIRAAERLEEIARHFRRLAIGIIKPHLGEKITPKVHAAIRDLVENWM